MDKKKIVKAALLARKKKGIVMGANPFPGTKESPKKGEVEAGTGAKKDSKNKKSKKAGQYSFFKKAKTRGV